MKKIRKIAREFDGKPRQVIAKISFVIFLVSFLIGFSAGLVFRELRLNFFTIKQKAQKIEEGRRLERLFQEFSQVKSFPQK